MKNLLSLLFAIPFIAFAQSPQGINYQAVAYDANGFELANQEISVRLGILLETADAESSYSETHQITTNNFGLFSLVISQGNSTDDFSSLNWENGAFLKVEIDEDLDGDYTLMGINSFSSVPYALYAESSGTPGPEGPQGEPADPVDYDSLASIIIADSLFTANVSGGIGGGCNILYPDGLDGSVLNIHTTNSETYTVPSGKTFYILNANITSSGTGGAVCTMKIDGYNYVVADGFVGGLTNPIPVGSGSVISLSGSDALHGYFNGYLVDENYFANCGGGSSSSATTNNQINNYNNILNQSVTSGTFNYLYASFPTNSSFNYTVPAGKIMKITDANLTNSGSNNPTYINGQLWHLSANLPTLISEGTQIEIQFSANDGDGVAIQYILFDI
jgi:hypothetical protein